MCKKLCKNLPDDQHLEEGRDIEGSNAEAKRSNKSLHKEDDGVWKTKERLQHGYGNITGKLKDLKMNTLEAVQEDKAIETLEEDKKKHYKKTTV